MPRKSWPKVHGHVTFLKDCDESGHFVPGEMISQLKDWKRIVKNQKTKVPVRCTVCNYETLVTLDNFHTRRSAKCFCTGAVPWCTQAGHAQLLLLIQDSRFEALPEMLSFSYWAATPKNHHSYLPIRCKDCKVVADTCEINSFVQHRTARCGCLWKTQRLVFEHIAHVCIDMYGDNVTVRREVVISKSKWPLRFDVAIFNNGKLVLLVEIDGGQHFRHSTGFPVDLYEIQQRDLKKELDAVKKGIPLLRLYQEDVWNEKFDWKSFTTRFVTRAVDGVLLPEVYRQQTKVYHTGEYAKLRQGTRVQVQGFEVSNVPQQITSLAGLHWDKQTSKVVRGHTTTDPGSPTMKDLVASNRWDAETQSVRSIQGR